MARRVRYKTNYVYLQSSAMARQVMEPAIERSLNQRGIRWNVADLPSGLRVYRVLLDHEATSESVVDAIGQPLVREAPDLVHLFHTTRDPGLPESRWRGHAVRGVLPKRQATGQRAATHYRRTRGIQ